jgi:hypothetical protein
MSNDLIENNGIYTYLDMTLDNIYLSLPSH